MTSPTTPQGMAPAPEYVMVPRVPTAAMISAMSESRARDDEGEFPMLLDLIDYSGENKTRTVLKAAYAAMLAAAPSAPVGERPYPQWRDISTAPKEVGAALLLYVPTRYVKWNAGLPLAGWWMGTFWATFNADEAVQRVAPTHWMPLPEPPGSAAIRGQEGEKT